MYSQRIRSNFRSTSHLFDQVSCFVLFFSFLSELLKQISYRSSFSFLLFFIHDCTLDHLVQFGFPFCTFSTAFVPCYLTFLSQWSPPCPSLRRFLSTFLVTERWPTCHANSVRRHRFVLPCHSLPCHLSRFAVITRFKTALVFFFTFDSLPLLGESA